MPIRMRPNFNLDSIYDIDIEQLKMIGVRALFFDLDSTLMKSKSGKFSFKTLQFLDDLKSNFKLAVITNNKRRSYIELASSQTDIPIYSNAKKPNINVMMKACRDLRVEPKYVAMVGDRPLSDILAGIRADMTTILVDSISKEDENPIVRFVRFLERLTVAKK